MEYRYHLAKYAGKTSRLTCPQCERPHCFTPYVDDDNNLMRYNLDDFFKLKMYKGDIYKVKNLRNLSLMQMYPDSAKLAHARDSIEQRLHRFDKNLWAPSRQELQAQVEAKRKLEAEKNGETLDEEGNATEAKEEKSVKRTTKRGSSSDKKDNKKSKRKVQKPKETKSNQGATRSVRNRKR